MPISDCSSDVWSSDRRTGAARPPVVTVPADLLVLLVVVGGALVGAVASGLAGFAFAACTLGLYAHFLPPGVVSPLVVAASLSVQLIVLPMIWRRLDWRAALPFLLGGICRPEEPPSELPSLRRNS